MSSNFPIHHGVKIAQGGYIVNAVVESLAADPSPVGEIGRIWFNSTENVYKQAVDNGSGGVAVKVYATVDQIEALQSELNATQVGAGLGTDGGYTADATTNYLTAATSLKDADKKLDTQIKTVADNLATETTNRTNADSALQTELDATQTGAGLGSSGTYTAPVGSNYLGAAVSLKDADSKLDAQIKTVADGLATEITNRSNADDALDGRLDTIEAAYIKKDGSVAFTGAIDAGTHKVVNVVDPTSAQDAATKNYVDAEIDSLYNQVTSLGSAFNYVGTIAGGADAGSAKDMALEAENDVGDYYKVSTAGYFKHSTVTAAFFANVNDGIVFNSAGGIDKIDSTDSTVAGTTNFIAVTGSADTGFTVDIASDFKTRMTTAEGAIAQEIVDRGTAVSGVQTELDATQTGAGLGTDGGYTAPVGSNYLGAASSLKDADSKLDTQIKTVADNLSTEVTNRTNADSAIQTELDATQTGAGLGTDGAYTAPVGSNYLGSASSLKDADSKLDTQIKSVSDELNTTQTGAGLGTDGTYTPDNTTNYLTTASSLKDADKKLDTQIKTVADNLSTEITNRTNADSAIQTELDATQTGAGLGTDGAYTANGSSNYLTSAVSLKDADNKLDAKIKAMFDAINNANFYVEKSTAATEHTIEHNLNSAALTFTVMVDRDGNGDWRNDVVSVKHTDNNTLTVYLSVAKKVRVSVQKVADISI